MDVCIAFIYYLQWCILLVFYCIVREEEKMELHAVQDMLQYCQCGWCVDGIQCEGWVGEYRLLSGVQLSDGLREEAVSCSAGSGPDTVVPSSWW